MTTTILPTRNEAWGFFGHHRPHRERPPPTRQGLGIAARRIAEETTPRPRGCATSSTARHGRHFADDVASELWKGETLKDAIDAAIARWMGWRIDRRTSRETGHPRTGFPT